MLLAVQSRWTQAHPLPVPAIILGVILIALRIYLTIQRSKNVHRSARVRRMERNLAFALWSFISLAILALFLSGRFR